MRLVQQFLSQENFQVAWKKVAKNKGGPGVDDETIEAFANSLENNLASLNQAVANSTYAPSPYKQILISKGEGNYRELNIPTVRDRVVQQALLNVLTPIAEPQFSSANFAYRRNRSYINAVEEVAHWRNAGYRYVLDADIEKFFDTIDHTQLLQKVRKYVDNTGILCLIKAWISVGVATDKGVIQSTQGIPQGAVISPLLANLYLNDFDHQISRFDVKLVRYGDDFIILGQTEEKLMHVLSEVKQQLSQLQLTIHPNKTQLTSFEKGFRFLGHGFLDNAIFPLESAKEQSQSSQPSQTNNRKKKLTQSKNTKKKGSQKRK